MLERYVSRCAEVVGDDGLCDGQPDKNGCRRIQVSVPKFEPELAKVEWKSLPAALMYEVLDFPNKTEIASGSVNAAFEYGATPPDFEEGFEERQYQFATLGIEASRLARKMRNHVGLPSKPAADWDPVAFMEKERSEILKRRKERTTRSGLAFANHADM
jgi:hypothetical protein